MTDPRAELAELTRQARAWVEWLRDCGVEELRSVEDPQALLELLTGETVAAQLRTPRAAATGTVRQRPAAIDVTSQPEHPPRAAPITPAEAIAPDARRKRLAELADEVDKCTKCRLHESRSHTVFGRGSPDTELVFVGEGPGAEEDRQGIPFVGPAGQLLDKMIAAMDYTRDDVYICNIVKCRPPRNRKPEPDEIAACSPYLREQLALIEPKVIVALGATGVQGLIGTTIGITRLRGTWKLYGGRVPLMPTFHPAYLLRSPDKKRDVWNDLKEVMRRLGKEPPPSKRRRASKRPR